MEPSDHNPVWGSILSVVDRARDASRGLPGWTLNLGVACFLVVFGNVAFFRNLLVTYPPSPAHLAFCASVAMLVAALILLLLTLVDARTIRKPLLVALLLLSSVTAHFMDRYNVVIDVDMIRSAVETDPKETRDLLVPGLLVYVALLGVLPALVVLRVRVARRPLWGVVRSKLAILIVLLSIIGVQLLAFNKSYASFLREHKTLRYYVNPLTCLYSAVRYASEGASAGSDAIAPRGTDAKIPQEDVHRELVVFVVGETARADHLALNGYDRPTNPRLSREGVISLSRMTACGTTTSIAVPCMFSGLRAGEFRKREATRTENLLDVLVHAGVHVLWRDNNTGSKGVAERVEHEDFRSPARNPICDVECRDEGMLSGLQAYVDGNPDGDVFIVLHQMGNHGPAYYKRYPESFAVFQPYCRTAELEDCTAEEIVNAYDNAILYTDYFLERVIDFLKRNENEFETCLFYVSDHGESLGEHGVYLHGLPNVMAPDAQTHVAAVLWFGKRRDVDVDRVQARAGRSYAHANVFHTVLGLLEIRTSAYEPALDILAGTRTESY